MKIVVINGSPETNNDNTSIVLNPFLEGMREAGVKVTLFYTEKLKIKPCRGCKKCLYKTPGECYQRDDMQVVLPELSQAQVWVYAIPLTSDGISAPMERLVDRLLPLTKPTVDSQNSTTGYFKRLVQRLRPPTKSTTEIRDNGAQVPSREGIKAGKLVLVSGGDNSDLGDFAPLVQRMRSIAQRHQKEFAGALWRPHAGVMAPKSKASGLLDDVVTAAFEAGQQLVLNGRMRPETLAGVSREILPRETFVRVNKPGFQQVSNAV